MLRSIVSIVMGVALILAVSAAGTQAQTLTLDKNMYKPGEKITVTFAAPGSYPGNAWVGIIPSNVPHGQESVNDQHDLAYQYLDKRTSGTLVFTAPKKSGFYDVRMNDTDNNGKEVASARSDEFGSFQVPGLAPGAYSVMASSEEGFAAFPVQVLSQDPTVDQSKEILEIILIPAADAATEQSDEAAAAVVADDECCYPMGGGGGGGYGSLLGLGGLAGLAGLAGIDGGGRYHPCAPTASPFRCRGF